MRKKKQLRLISVYTAVIMLMYMNVNGQDVIVSGTNLSANVSGNEYNLPHVKHAQKCESNIFNNN